MTGFSKQFLAVAGKLDGKALDQQVVQGSKYGKFLGEGTHDVRVSGIDKNKLATENKFTVKWADDAGREQNDTLTVLDQDKKTGAWGLHWKFANVLGALIPSTEAYDAFLAEVNAGNANVLDMLVSLRCRITLERGKGYGAVEHYVDDKGADKYRVRNVKTQEVVGEGDSGAEAEEAAKSIGLRKSYVNVVKYVATEGEANIALFSAALAGANKPKAAPAFPFASPKKDVDGIPF